MSQAEAIAGSTATAAADHHPGPRVRAAVAALGLTVSVLLIVTTRWALPLRLGSPVAAVSFLGLAGGAVAVHRRRWNWLLAVQVVALSIAAVLALSLINLAVDGWIPTTITLGLGLPCAVAYAIALRSARTAIAAAPADFPTLARPPRALGRRVSRLMSVVVVSWVAGVVLARHHHTGDTAALTPLLVFVLPALVLTTLALVLAARAGPEAAPRWLLVGLLTVLVVMVHAVAPLVYEQARFAWTYKHFGISDYIRVHHGADTRLDVFQNWPGFFGALAWMTQTAHSRPLLGLAQWWPLVVELLTTAMVVLLAKALRLADGVAVLAGAIYLLTAWIGQDYLSPQSVGFLLVLALTVWALRRLTLPPDQWRRRPSLRGPRAIPRPLDALGILAVFIALVPSHQLSPFFYVLIVGALVLWCGLSPRWLLPAVTLSAVAYALLRSDVLFRQRAFGGVGLGGNAFIDNADPTVGPVSRVLVISDQSRLALTGGLYLAGIVALVCWRRAQPAVAWVVAVIAGCTSAMVVVVRYGTEGPLRVYLFLGPWLSVAVAGGLLTALEGSSIGWRRVGRVGGIAALGVVPLLFVVAYFGYDGVDQIGTDTVRASLTFERQVAYNDVFVAMAEGSFPTRITGTYPWVNWFSRADLLGGFPADGTGNYDPSADLGQLEAVIRSETETARWFAAFSPELDRAARLSGFIRPGWTAAIEAVIDRSPRWHLVIAEGATHIYQYVGPT